MRLAASLIPLIAVCLCACGSKQDEASNEESGNKNISSDAPVAEPDSNGDLPDNAELANESDQKQQAVIARAIEAMRTRKPDQVERFYRALADLREAGKSDKDGLVNQLAIFASRVGDVDVLRVRLILDRLELSDASIIRALAPHLDSTNPSVRSFARDWFQYHDNASRWSPDRPLEPLNFSEYGDYVRNRVRRKEAIPKAFVNYIYSRAPGHALLAFFYAHEGPQPKRRDLLWSEHIIRNTIWMKENGFDEAFARAKPEAIEHLRQLSEHEQWWVRLYVARITTYPDLHVTSIREVLLNDKNELVRQEANTTEKSGDRPLKKDRSTGVRVERAG